MGEVIKEIRVVAGHVVVPARPADGTRIAVAQDAAFGFYYADDLDALAAQGVELVPFDTLRDAALPDCDGLFIGGGFPECFLAGLEANTSLRSEIRQAIEDGMPAYAECGGLMYLSRSIEWRGQKREMVGVIPGDVAMHDRPVGRGYVILQPTAAHPWREPGTEVPTLHAHEFHYSAISGLPAATRYAYAMRRGHGIDGKRDGIVHRNLLASYTHLRATAGCDWPEKFVRFVRRKKAERSGVPIQ